ncbi:MAG: DUF1538 family protein, partial [Gammaproteobacteria bacterium]|nr:DUF1538 family protein [Gammaproteobacteria bacterium]
MGTFLYSFRETIQDLAPIILVIGFFQLIILRQPIPDIEKLLVGTLLVVIGLNFFMRGLE